MNELRIKEQRELMIKITRHLGRVLKFKLEVEKWTSKELFELSGIPQARISEIINFDKYQRPINLNILMMAIKADILRPDELIDQLPLDPREKNFIDRNIN